MGKIHPQFRVLSVSRCLASEEIRPNRIRCAIEDVKQYFNGKRGQLIGIAIEKCPLTVLLMLGILESENAFIFIPSDSESYMETMVEKFKVNLLIRRKEMVNSEKISVDSTAVWIRQCSDFQMPWNSPICYAIQTSGTTGKPKTVHVPRECIYLNILDFRDRFNVTDSDVILQLTSLTFDPSMVEILLAAETGATLIIFTEELGLPTLSAQPSLLATLIKKIRPTFLQMTPSCLGQFKRQFLADLLGPRSDIRILLLGGEAFPLNLVNSVRSADNTTRIFNVYGVTEVSCWASVQEVIVGQKHVSAGSPIQGSELQVIDGEVVIGGERFCYLDFGLSSIVPHHTGDLGHYCDGKIIVTGRNKPNAILPSTEVEDLILGEFEEVVLAKIIFDGNFAILFYKSEDPLDSRIKDALETHLPHSKRPGLVCHVVEWAVTKNGKVDDETLLREARKRIQVRSRESVQSLLEDYGISLERDLKETFHNLGFSSLQATELLFKLDPLIKKEVNGQVHQLLLSPDGKVCDLIQCLDFTSVMTSPLQDMIVELDVDDKPMASELHWESDLKKCIDASPVYVDGLALVGSHAGIFKAIDIETGEERISLNVDGRIEKTCGVGEKYIAFGTYKGKLYVLDRSSLALVTVFELGNEVIKCTPVFDSSNRLYCGSHDRHVVKLNVTDNSVDYRVPLNGAIVSTPLIVDEDLLIAATLNGFVYRVNKHSGEIEAESCLKSPIFAPIRAFQSHGFLATSVTGTIVLFSRTLEERSRIDLTTHQYDAPCVLSDSQLISCGQNGSIHVLHYDGGGFQSMRTIFWKNVNIVKAPVILNNFFIFSATSGAVISIHKDALLCEGLEMPHAKKLLQLSGETFGIPTFVKTRDKVKLIIGSRDNFLRCFCFSELC